MIDKVTYGNRYIIQIYEFFSLFLSFIHGIIAAIFRFILGLF